MTLENTRPHDITLHATLQDRVESVTIPAAKENPDNREEMINGRAECDPEIVEAAKKHKVVQHYFKEGWLREVKAVRSTRKGAAADDGDDDDGKGAEKKGKNGKE